MISEPTVMKETVAETETETEETAGDHAAETDGDQEAVNIVTVPGTVIDETGAFTAVWKLITMLLLPPQTPLLLLLPPQKFCRKTSNSSNSLSE